MGRFSTIPAKGALKWHSTRLWPIAMLFSGASFSTAWAAPFPPLIPEQYGFTQFGGWETSIAANPRSLVRQWASGYMAQSTQRRGMEALRGMPESTHHS